MKKILSLALTLFIIAGLFSCLTLVASAEQEVWESSFDAKDFSGSTGRIYSGLFLVQDGSTDTFEIVSRRSFNLDDGFSISANLKMSNGTATYLGEHCSIKIGNVELRLVNTKDVKEYSAVVYVGETIIGSANLGESAEGKFRLCMDEDEIWVLINDSYLTLTNTSGKTGHYLVRPNSVDVKNARLSFKIMGNGSSSYDRRFDKFLLVGGAATKYDNKDVYMRITSYEAAENEFFSVPERSVIYTGDKIKLDYNAWTKFTWPNGTVQTEWNMRADNGQKGQPQNGYMFSFTEPGEHTFYSSTFGYKLATITVVDRFYAPTSAQEEESTDTKYPDGSSLPFTDKLVKGDTADIYENPVENGTFFTSDLWQAVPLISQELVDLGYSGGEGCQLINSVAYGNDGKLAFLGTDVGGLYKSVDGGSNWYLSTVGFDANGATSIVVDPKNNNRVLCIGASSGYDETNGIYLSTDAGETWNYVYSVVQNSTGVVGYHGDTRIQLAYDISSYDASLGYCKVVYWSREHNSGSSDYNYPMLYKSTDGGYTWNEIPNSSAYAGGQIRVSADTGWVFVNTNSKIYRSKDGGNSWKEVLSDSVTGFDMVTTYPSNLYATGSNGYYVSTDYGETWDCFKGNRYEINGYTITLRVSPIDPNNVIFQQFISDYNYIIYYSNDGGYNWSTSKFDYTGNWTGTSGASISAFAWSPIHKNSVMVSAWGGIYRSINGGSDFFWSNAGFNSICGGGKINFNVNHPEMISIASQDFNGGYSLDSGKTWTYINWGNKNWGGFTYGTYILNANTIITGVATAMYGNDTYIKVTHDGGKTITDTGIRIDGARIGCGALNDDNIAFLGEYRTTDGGYTFTKMNGCSGVFTIDLKTGRLFGSNGNYVVTSTDNGATWTTVGNVSGGISDIAYSNELNTIYVVDGNNLYTCKPDFSLTSNSFNRRGFGYYSANSVAVDPNNEEVVYIGCSSAASHNMKATWRSLDGGNTWTCLTRAAGDGRECADGGKQPLSIRVSPVTGELFVLTGCRGVWKIAAPPQWYLDAQLPAPEASSLFELISKDIAANSKYTTADYSESDVTYIYTKQDLWNVRNNLNGFYILANDIVFNDSDFAPGGAFYNGGAKWSPYVKAYTSSNTAFRGIFYGNGYAIKNLQISDTSASYLSMFGRNDGLIMKVGFENCKLQTSSGTLYACLITALNYGQIVNCYIKDGLVDSPSDKASLVAGFGNVDTIIGCYVHGNIVNSPHAAPSAFLAWPGGADSVDPANLNYYLKTGAARAAGDYTTMAKALTAKKMLYKSSYTNFDFENVWQNEDGVTMPTLRHLEFTTAESENWSVVLESDNPKLRIGKTIKTHVKLIDENGNEIEGDFHFYTTTPDVVSVSENGDVTGLNGGTAYVYAAEYTTGQIVRLTVAVTLTTIIGDANIDDTINSLDILLVQQHILGYTELTGVSWHNCDIDGDLALDAIDLSMLQMMILGLA